MMDSSDPMFLTTDELEQLTGRMRRSAQAAELDAMGVPYRVRRSGSIVVLRVAVQIAFGATQQPEKPRAPRLRL